MHYFLLRRLLLLLAVTLIGVATASAAVERRVALVIGNGAYKNTVELPNAPNDARAISAKLGSLGFKVVEGIDLSQAGMTAKLKEFSHALEGADVGLFFYAGHGLQIGGENYLVPVDAVLKSDRDVDFETLKVDMVLKQLLAEAKIKVVILDACRDNPLATALARSMSGSSRSRSLAPSSGLGEIDARSASGSLIAFATAPGTTALDGTGSHSPFTEALLQHIGTPGVDIEAMLKRVRGQVASLTKDRQQPWTNSSINGDFYMNPTSSGAAAPAPVVASTQQSNDTAQRGLSSGFDQRQIELQLWQDAKASNSPAAYKAYLDQFPNGTFAALARESMARLSGNGSAAAQQASAGTLNGRQMGIANPESESAMSLSDENWRQVQRRLTALGFGTRGIDGAAGQGTRQAIRDWQKSNSLTESGYLNRPQYEAIVGEAPDKFATSSTAASSSSSSNDRPSRRSRRSDDDDDSRSSRGSSGSTARALGEAAGGFVRGITRLPF